MATGQLMFEVGIKSAQEQLDKIKQEFTKANGDLQKLLNLKVSIDGVDAVTKALNQIGDTTALRNLRNEIAALNREFSILSKGAGGSGDIAGRGLAADIERTSQSIERYTSKIKQLTEERTRLVGGTRNSSYQIFTDKILSYELSLEGARKKLAELNEQKNKPVASEPLKKATQDAHTFETALGRIETAIGGLKSGMSVNLTGDFSKWAQEVQSVTASVRELVEQLQKMNTATSAQSATETTKAQTQAVLEESDAYKQLAKWREQAEKFFKTNNPIADQNSFIGHAVNGIVLGDKTSLETIKQHIYLQKDENKLLAERKLLEEQIAKSNIRKHEQKTNYQDVLGVYDKVLSALQQVKQTEQTPTPKGGLFDPQQFKGLQEAIDAVIREINRLKEAFAGVGEIRGLSQLTDSMNALFHNVSTFKDVFATLSAAVNLTPTSEYVKKLQTDFEAAQAKVKELTEKLTALAAAQNNVAETVSKAGKSEKQIGDSQAALFNRYNKLLADIQNIEREALNLRNTLGGNNPYADGLRDYIISLGKIRTEVKNIASSPSVADAITKGMSSEQLAKLNSALAALKTNFKEVIADAKDFNKATDKGSSQAEARIRKLGMAFNELKNYMRQNGGSEEMKRLQTEIQGAIRKMRDLMNAGNFAGAINVYERLSGLIRQAATATKEFEKGQQGLSSSVSHANSNLQHQSQILSDLKTMATQYLSVWGAQSFINNIIELGGQLEQQRLSIGAILQDSAQANHLFGQIKDLAIKSPFGVQQLDAMTKQLSAYGFQYSELYEWTKRLADISAATGTSVDRLALALGHVRAEGALSGYTLRQFSMGNIPLLQKLSENLGKTKQEIRKMTRNKEIGYEDVLNVLKQLTDESGMFYQAQETMSQALNAKFKNLRDSFQIMYSEMAEGAPGDFLKGLATTLTDLSRQWQILMPMVGAAGAMWAMNRASAALVNVELAKMATLTNANTLASSKYSVAQLRQIANWEKMPHAMVRARLALQGFKTSLLSLGKMVFSWPTAIFAAIEALTYMWAKQSRESEKAKEMTEVLTNTALESQKNLAKQLSNIDPYEKGMSDSAMKTGIDSMIESIKNYGINAQSVLETVYGKDAEGRVMSLAEKYQYLRDELEKTEKVYKEMQRTSGGIEFGVEFTDGGWLDDDVQSDLTNYAEAVKEYEDAFVTMTANYATAVNNALEQVKKASPEFKRIADGLSSDAERVKWLYENQGEYGGIYNIFKGALHREDPNAGGGVLGTQLGDNLRSAEQEAMKELDQFLKGTEEWFKKFGYDFTENGKNLSEVQVGNLLRQSKEWLEKHPEWQNIYDVIWDKLNKRWGLPIVPDVSEVEEELPQWLIDFQKELDKTGIKLTADMSMEQIIDLMKKAYDKAQTTINKLGPIAIKAGIKLEGLTDNTIEQYKFLNPELYETLKELKGQMDSQSQIDTAGKKRGVVFKGMKKDGTHKAEKMNTESAKAVRERVRVIKEAADAFQYWREKVGDKGAWEHVQKEFGDVLRKIDITATNIEDVRGHLKRIPEMKEYKAITDKKVKTEIDKEIAKENDQYTRKDFERDTERFLSQTQIQLDSLTRAWELFNDVRESTGNLELAVKISGVGGDGTRNLADDLKKKIQNDLAQIGVNAIPFDFNFSDKDIKEEVENAFERFKPQKPTDENDKKAMNEYNDMLSEYQSKIKGFIEIYKKWRDLQRNVTAKDLKIFADLLGKTEDYGSKLTQLRDKLSQTLESINLSKGTPEQKSIAARRAVTSEEWEEAQLSAEFANLFNNAVAMSKTAFESEASYIEGLLNDLFELGLISTEKMKEWRDKITKARSEYSTSGFLGIKGSTGAFFAGGYQGLIDYRKSKRNKIQEELSRLDPKSEEYKKKEKELKVQDQLIKKNEAAVDSMNKVMTAAKALKDGFDLLADLFNNMGANGMGDTMSDASSLLGGVMQGASTFSALGPYGMAAGAAIGLVSGIFALQDKSIQREIDALKENAAALEENTQSIKDYRQRTLGYDEGKIRKSMADTYINTIVDAYKEAVAQGHHFIPIMDSSQFAMAKYYATNYGMSGYQAELENLKALREDYRKMYKLEHSKKNVSDEALREYTKQIAELDEQIFYFTEDLANELWGIDFKAWASQISDALWTAFENGESALEAFHDTARDIISDVAKRMMNIHLIEPVFNKLEERLFGKIDENGVRTGGVYNETTGQFDENETLRILGQFFGEDGEFAKVIESAEDFYEMAQRVTGFNLADDDGSSSASRSIKGITEQTADLLSAYLNAVRLDVSVIRTLDAKVVQEYWPSQIRLMTSGTQSLSNIEQHTLAIMRSNDVIAERITNLDNNINGLKSKTWSIPIA